VWGGGEGGGGGRGGDGLSRGGGGLVSALAINQAGAPTHVRL
jgi:hypothetical protein